MAREEVDAVYIGSNDFWGFDSDTFNEETNFYGRAWVVPASKATPKMVEDENLSRCQMYYEIGKTDTHLFTPTQIVFDDEQDVVMIRGNQGRIGQPEVTDVKTRVFRVGQDAQRYKNLTSGPKSADGGRFTVNFIIPDSSDEKTKIKAFIEDLDKEESAEEATVADAEEELSFGDVGEGNNFGQMRAEEDAYDYTPELFSPYDDPMDYSPYESEDIVDYFQDLPVIRDFRLGGWTASAIVVGVAALSGAWFSKRRG